MTSVSTSTTRTAIGNQWLERSYAISDDRLVASTVHNRVSGTSVACGPTEFRLEIDDRRLTAEDCHFVASDYLPAAEASDGHILCLRFAVDDLPVEIEVHAWGSATEPWLYKQLGVVNRGDRPLTLYTAAVEWFTPAGESFTYAVEEDELEHPAVAEAFHEAVGQPVFTESLFWGLEFPHSLSGRTATGELRLQHFPGRRLAPGEDWESKRAVVGAAATGRVHDAFDRYCLSLRPFADPYRFVNWECCWLAIPPTYAEGKPFLQFLKQRLVDDLGSRLDAFDLSCMTWTFGKGLDGYKREGLWQPGEADVHEKMSADCRAAGIPYGMYFCANSFLPFAETSDWGRQQGFGFAAESSYCLAEPRYRAAITERVLDCVRRYELGVVTFDMMWQGNGFGCQTEGHGHLVDRERDPIGRFGTEAVIDAHLDLLTRIREINPEIIVSMMTYNWWGSPWWLPYTDVVHSVSGDTPASQTAISPRFRDHLIAGRDEQLHAMYVTRNRKLPMWGNDSFMGLQVRREFIAQGHPLNADDPKEQWEDELIMATAGHLHAAFLNCVDHRILDETPSGLEFYAGVLKWAEAHRHTLYDTRMILGDPSAGEPVGYAHRGDAETILCLRNNTMTTTTLDLSLTADLLPFGAATDLVATLIYPYCVELADGLAAGDVLSLELPPHQAHVIRLQPAGTATAPRVTGARYSLRPSEDHLEIDLWGIGGTTGDVAVTLPASETTERVSVAFDSPSPTNPTWKVEGPKRSDRGHRAELEVRLETESPARLLVYLEHQPGDVDASPVEDASIFESAPTLQGWIQLLREYSDRGVGTAFDTSALPDVTIRHEANGQVAGTVSDRQTPTGSIAWRPRTAPTLSHGWYLVDLAPGLNRITIEIASDRERTRLGCWIERHLPLTRSTLRFPLPNGSVLPPLLPLVRPEEEYRVDELLPLQLLTTS